MSSSSTSRSLYLNLFLLRRSIINAYPSVELFYVLVTLIFCISSNMISPVVFLIVFSLTQLKSNLSVARPFCCFLITVIPLPCSRTIFSEKWILFLRFLFSRSKDRVKIHFSILPTRLESSSQFWSVATGYRQWHIWVSINRS